MTKTLNTRSAVPSAFNIISSNRSIGYSMEAAVADIIDNSISANATEIELLSPASAQPVLYIVDNGTGMNQQELDNAMTFGGKLTNCMDHRSKNDLGRFGMGLKTATLSQCKKLEVITKKNGIIIGGCWDLDYIKNHDSWNYQVITEVQCQEKIKNTLLEHSTNGTAVIWSNFDRLKKSASKSESTVVFDNYMDKTVKKLELIFHRYLAGEEDLDKIKITYNKNDLEPNDPFNTHDTYSSTQRIIPLEGGNVTVLAHKLLHPSKYEASEFSRLQLGSTLLETQGFYIYRNKRLIDYGTWFGMAPKLEKTKLSRIQIDFPNTLDSMWSLDIKKSRAIPPEKIRSELRNVMNTNGDKSTRTYKTRKRQSKGIKNYWTKMSKAGGRSWFEINSDHPLVEDFLHKLTPEMQQEFSLLMSNISKFFPYDELELAYQNDEVRVNEISDIDNNQLKNKINYLLSLGFSTSDIKNCFPGKDDEIDRITGEN